MAITFRLPTPAISIMRMHWKTIAFVICSALMRALKVISKLADRQYRYKSSCYQAAFTRLMSKLVHFHSLCVEVNSRY